MLNLCNPVSVGSLNAGESLPSTYAVVSLSPANASPSSECLSERRGPCVMLTEELREKLGRSSSQPREGTRRSKKLLQHV